MTKSSSIINTAFIPALVLICIGLIIYALYNIWKTHDMAVVEGFRADSGLKRLKQSRTSRGSGSNPLKTYGFITKKANEKFADVAGTSQSNNREKAERLKKLSSGDQDNFQDVLDEIDMIDPTAFTFRSMGNTINRYNDNLNRRLNRANKKHNDNRLDRTMAQGSILWDEFKKMFLFTNMF
jgi:hypothetical protein